MDGISSTASIIGVIELAAKIGSTCAKYSIAVKHANRDIARLQDEVQSLREILERVQEVYQANDACQPRATSMVQYLTRCKERLDEILNRLKPTHRSRLATKIGFDQLTWPLKKKEVDKLIDELEQSKSSISLAMQLDEIAMLKHLKIEQDSPALPIAEGASFDSFSDQLNARCHGGTRVALRQEIRDWFDDPAGSCIFWLNGMAGTGKSTILRTVAQEFYDRKQLGASFFFKRGEGPRGNASLFCTTIASQLMHNFPALRPSIQAACMNDPQIYDKTISEQFKRLVWDPVVKYEQIECRPLLIVVDALDECDEHGSTNLILQQFSQIEESNCKGFRLLLTSRPESAIMTAFRKLSDTVYFSFPLQEIPDTVVRNDIRLYIQDELYNIREQHPEFEIPEEWPTETQIGKLMEIAGTLFIAAATICRFICDSRLDPEHQLNFLLSYNQDALARGGAFDELDRIYQPILDQMLVGLNDYQQKIILDEFQLVVGSIVVLEDVLSIRALAALLETPRRLIRRRLAMLQSVLRIPSQDDEPVRFLHLSFRDFITRKRLKDNLFWIDQRQVHEKVGQASLKLLCSTPLLKQNICDIGRAATRRRDIDKSLVLSRLEPQICYACRYWIRHVVNGECRLSDQRLIYKFLETRFLYWIEALTVLGNHIGIESMLKQMQAHFQKDSDSELKQFLEDAIRFISTTIIMLDMFPMQLYSSGLAFTSKESIIRAKFDHLIPPVINKLPKAENLSTDSPHISSEHMKYLDSIVLSPDGMQFASSSRRGTIKLWRSADGQLQHTIDSNKMGEMQIAYMLNGRLLMSHSDRDLLIMIWSSQTGRIEHILDCESEILSVVPSTKGRFLVTCHSTTIELWDIAIAERKWIIQGSAAVAPRFSSNDERLVIASYGGRIAVTSVSDGTDIYVFQDLSEYIISPPSFSPQDTYLVARFIDEVRIWSMITGKLHSCFPGHFERFTEFFKDESRLVFIDPSLGTANAMDLTTRCFEEAYQDCNIPVVFSQYGTLFASGRKTKKNIAIWNTNSATVEGVLEVDSRTVYHMIFFEDNQKLLMLSGDTIILWDLHNWSILYRIAQTYISMSLLKFMSGGQQLLSYADNNRINIWNTDTGELLHRLHSESWPLIPTSTDRYVGYLSEDGIHLQDVEAGMQLRLSISYMHRSVYFEFLPELNQFVSSFAKLGAIFWDAQTGDRLAALQDDMCVLLRVVTISPDRKNMATGYSTGLIRMWDLPTKRLVQTLSTSIDQVFHSLKYSFSGRHILSLVSESVSLWDCENATEQWTFNTEGYDFEFSTDDKQVAITRTQGGIQILDSCTGDLIQVVSSSFWPLSSRGFSENNAYLNTSRGMIGLGDDVTINLPTAPLHVFFEDEWLKVNGQEILWLPNLSRPTAMDCHDGKIAVGFPTGEVVLYDMTSGTCRQLVQDIL